ncbi:G2/mitotic-specific cyclin-B-like [Panonychus citri]|uniref:G2/mitotic-specific cyclin-B-like n=1 Tax=Panonychus citri TaxID=50023 RepID=UPI0023083608|nr:G2/mitotic-specific cyclin-B-like [Panonychus citri]
MDVTRNRFGGNLLLKPNIENKHGQQGVLFKRSTGTSNSSLINQVKRSALQQTTNIQNKVINEASKLNLKSIKDELPDPIKPVSKESSESVAEAKGTNKQSQNVKQVTGECPVEKVVSKIPRLSLRPSGIAEVIARRVTKNCFSSAIIPEDVENIDENDELNVFLTTDYVNDIYKYLRQLESKYQIKPNSLISQKEYTPKMRSILIDWLISVHYQFHLTPETLYMTVGILDRFCQAENINKNKVQLVGITSMFIASKYEEIYPPEMNDFVSMCDNLYHKKDIIKMEIAILKGLKFELGRPLPLHFLRRMSKAAHADAVIHTMAKYLMELCLVEYECVHWDPSLVAATALYTTLRIVGEGSNPWSSTLKFYSHYSDEQLQPYVSVLCKIILRAPNSKFQSCRKKYGSTKLSRISKRPELESQVIQDMANGLFLGKKSTVTKQTQSSSSLTTIQEKR